MTKKDNGDDKQSKKDKKNVINFQDYKKKVPAPIEDYDDSEDPENFMVLADLNDELANMCLTSIFPDGVPQELEGDYNYFIMALAKDSQTTPSEMLGSGNLVFEDIDFEDDYEIILGELIEIKSVVEKLQQEKELMTVQIEKLENELKKKSTNKKSKTDE